MSASEEATLRGDGSEGRSSGSATTAHGEAPGGLRRGDSIGRYVVLSRVGSGAMGTVYAAFDPVLDRSVAIKQVRFSCNAGQVDVLREAQTLAKLAHPNIVAVHDVLALDDGLAIAMDFVDGVSLRTWLTERPRRWQAVTRVLVAAGRGLAAAHRAGIVHRDFKPDNVMVERGGGVFVVDFGLARLDEGVTVEEPTGSPAVDRATRGTFGTPAYMACETLNGEPADARSDQFSYFVTLYEALYGERPFQGGSLAELAVQVMKGVIDPPSTADVPARVRRVLVRGLSQDPALRWSSMEAAVNALDRTLGAPRRAATVGVVAVGVAAVPVAVLFGATLGVRPCAQAEERLDAVWDPAVAAAIESAFDGLQLPWTARAADRTVTALEHYAEAWTDAWTESCEATRVRGEVSAQMLDRRAICLDARRRALAATTQLLQTADLEVARRTDRLVSDLPRIEDCSDLEALAEGIAEPDAPKMRDALAAVRDEIARANVLATAGKYPEGLTAAQRAEAEAGVIGWPPVHAEALFALGDLQELNGQAEQAEATLGRGTRIALAAGDDVTALRLTTELVYVVGADLERPEAAMAWSITADALAEKLDDPVLRAATLHNRGLMHQAGGRWLEAETDLRAALDLRIEALGEEHDDVSTTMTSLADVLDRLGRHAESLALYERDRAYRERVFGSEHPRMATVLSNMSESLANAGKTDVALEYAERALAIFRKTLPPGHPDVVAALQNLMVVHWARDDLDACERVLEETFALYEAYPPQSPAALALVTHNAGGVAWARKDFATARRRYERAIALYEQVHGPDDPEIADSLSSLAVLDWEDEAWSKAHERHTRALAILERAGAGTHRTAGRFLRMLAREEMELGQHETALATAKRALVVLEHTEGEEEETARTYRLIAPLAWTLGRPDEARQAAEWALPNLPEDEREELQAWLAAEHISP